MGTGTNVRVEEAQNLRCRIYSIRYQADDFSICTCATEEKIPFVADERDSKIHQFTLLGYGLPKTGGRDILVSGQWEWSTKYNQMQLRMTSYTDYVGQSKSEIVAYLSSGILNGIGKKTAEAIYAKFGEDSLSILEADPEQLLQVPGIKKKKLQKVLDSYMENHSLNVLTRYLAPFEIPFSTILRIYQKFGRDSVTIVKKNPYRLCAIPGMGFKTVDRLALKMEVSRRSHFRISGAVKYSLRQAQTSEGHLFLPLDELVARCCSEQILNGNGPDEKEQVTPEDVISVIQKMLENEILKALSFSDDLEDMQPRIYLRNSYTDETLSACSLTNLIQYGQDSKRPKLSSCEKKMRQVERELNVELDPLQEKAVLTCLTNSVSIITGGPGTGKTTTLRVLVKTKEAFGTEEENILLAAPTGRAARRMTEQTGHDAFTLHSLLGLKPDSYTDFFDPEEAVWKYPEAEILIVDESSMIDAHLLAELLFRLPPDMQLVFVGDIDQLPSVGPGNVLKELLSVREIPHTKLEKVFRQGEDSVIPVNSQRVKKGDTQLLFNRYFKFFPCENEQEGADRIIEMFSRSKVQSMLDAIQILAPMRSRGATCINHLNRRLQGIVNPPAADKAESMVGETLFRVGDKVMQTKNTHSVSNGDIGYITQISPMIDDDKNSFSMIVQFDQGNVRYDYMSALELELATAITIHKSQGSEFPVVVIPIFSSMSFFLQRNLLYTAISRAKQQVVLIGQEKAIQLAIWKIDNTKRNTTLARLVEQFIKEGQ